MHGIAESDQRIVLEGITWDTYLHIDHLLGNSRSVRLKFTPNRLEIMSPSREHEHIKSNLGCMIELYCRREKIFFQTEGSATIRREGERGGEPDESYIFTKGSPDVELAIETALTSGGIDKLDFYGGLGIPELWIWENDALSVYLFQDGSFQDGSYERAEKSRFLPGLDLTLVSSLVTHPYTSEVLDRFESALEGLDERPEKE